MFMLFLCNSFRQVYSLCVMMQSSAVDFSAATDLLEVIRTGLTKAGLNDDYSERLWTESLSLINMCGIKVAICDDAATSSRPARKLRLV